MTVTTLSSAPLSGWRIASLWFGALVVLSLLLFHDTVASLITTWWDTKTYNHGFLILPIALWLAWGERRPVLALAPRPEPWALLGVAAAALLWLVGEAAETTLLRQIALIGLLNALVPLAFGWPVARRLAFPLLFLWFMIPVGDDLVPELQSFTAGFSVALVRAAGIPVFHDGILIQTPGGLFEIAEACAGIRFLIANIVVVALFSHFAFRTWWKVAIMIGLGVVVPLLANGLRAAAIMLIGNWTQLDWAVGFDHVVYGWGFFAAVMLSLLWLGSRFAEPPSLEVLSPPEPPAAPADGEPAGTSGRRLAPLAAALVILAVPAYAHLMIRVPGPALGAATVAGPEVAGWERREGLPDWRPSFVGADRTAAALYRDARGGEVLLYAAVYDHQRQGAKVVSRVNRFDDDKRWRRVDSWAGDDLATLAGTPPRVERLVGAGGRQRIVLWWYWVAGRLTDDATTAKLLQLRAALFRGQPAAAVLAVAADVDADSPVTLVTPRLQAFLRNAGDLGGWLGRVADAGRPETRP